MKKRDVPVQFTGVVMVSVPDHLPNDDATLLARKVALSRILATCENPDAPEEDACDDYADECSGLAKPTAEHDWDQCTIVGVGGQWSISS